MSAEVKMCFGCQADARPPPEVDFGKYTCHVLALVAELGHDAIVAKLCPEHASLYGDMVIVGKATLGGIRA